LLFHKPEEWAASVQPCKSLLSHQKKWQNLNKITGKSWRVIKTEEVTSIIDLLSAADREEVKRLAPVLNFKPLCGRWLDSMSPEFTEGDCKGLRLYRPRLTGEEWFWLGQTVDSTKALVVKELIPGALGKIESLDIVWDSEKKFLGKRVSIRSTTAALLPIY
jgi:hypothetical protein